MTSHLLDDLNPTQQQAVQAIDSPVLVLAGPGSGKTRVLTYRIAYLITHHAVDPTSILAVTFTNKAAREMKERLTALIGVQDTTAVAIGTFHSFCTRFLRRDIVHLNRKRDFTIYDGDDQQRLMRSILKELNVDEKKNAPRSILSSISAAKSEMITPQNYLMQFAKPTYYHQMVARCYEPYQTLLQQHNALDFDDLLLETVRLFTEHPDILAYYHRRYRYVLVDEYQDTNRPQYEFVKQLAAKERNVFVIGDDDQSIYAWRGADVRNILSFTRDYPDATVFTLEQNYRSTQAILDVAQSIIHPSSQNKKHLWTEKGAGLPVVLWEGFDQYGEAQLVAEEIRRLVQTGTYHSADCAVMYRTNAQSRAIEEAFISYGMPYQLVGGMRFYERKEIKDVLAYLRVLHNTNDVVSLLRIINTPSRGIGERTIENFNRWAEEQHLSLFAALQHIAALHDATKSDAAATPPPSATATLSMAFTGRIRNALIAFYHLIETFLTARPTTDLIELFDTILSTIGYKQALIDTYGNEEGKERWDNVQELRNVAEEYCWLPIEEQLTTFLQEVALVADTDHMNDASDATTCITLHQAKGLEYPIVFLLGLEEGLLPHSRSIENSEQIDEERRLFYVGATRAKERLYLLRAFRRSLYGSYEVTTPSRFLADIPPHLLAGRTRKTASRVASSTSKRSKTTPPVVSPAPAHVAQPNVSATPKPPAPSRRTTRTRSRTPQKIAAAHTTPHITFVPGEHVHHHLFGDGVVMNSRRVPGGDEEVLVSFPKHGEKRLLATFAKLQKIA